MKKHLLRLVALCLIVAPILQSCKSEESVIDVPEITGISFVDYPDVSLTLIADSIPLTFANSTKLPAEAGKTQPISISLQVTNFSSVEVYVSESQSIQVFKTRAISLEYKPLYFLRINSPGGLSKVYALRMDRVQPAAPQMLSADINLDPTGISPLAGVIKITSDQEVKLAYTVVGQDDEDFSMQTDGLAKTQQLNLFGLYANYSNRVLVRITNADGAATTREFFVKTQPLPQTVPQADEIRINKADLANSTTQFVMFFPFKTTGFPDDLLGDYYPIGVDRFGKIRWYLKKKLDNSSVLKKLSNGHWMLSNVSVFTELDLLGNIYGETPIEHDMHHDFVEMPDGDILYLADNTAPHNTIEDMIYRVDRTGAIKDEVDLYTMLDPTRPELPSNPDARDWFHANSLYYEASDNSIVVSGRHQSAVVRIDLATKSIKWILSNPDHWNDDLKQYLLTPSGDNFIQQFGQHSAILNPADPSRLLLFDNGNWRSYTDPLPPSESFTRLVEYKIDGTAVTQQFEFGRQYGSELFAPYLGNVGFIGDSKYFICFGGIYKNDAGEAIDLFDAAVGHNLVRFMEITNQGDINLDISIERAPAGNGKGIRSYRAYPFNFN